MPETPLPVVRARVSTSISTKGILTFDATVEVTSPIMPHPDLAPAEQQIDDLTKMVEAAQNLHFIIFFILFSSFLVMIMVFVQCILELI